MMEEGKVLKWILMEADLWVEPPLVEQIFLIESTRQEVGKVDKGNAGRRKGR